MRLTFFKYCDLILKYKSPKSSHRNVFSKKRDASSIFVSFESRPVDISYVSSRGRGFSRSENAGKDGGRGKHVRFVCVCLRRSNQ